MNEFLFRWLNNFAGRASALDALILFFTDSLGIVLVFTLFLYIMHAFYHERSAKARRTLEAFVVACLAWMIGFVIKAIVAAPRPFLELSEVRRLLAYGDTDAFPSGHATFYFALAGAIFLHDKKLGIVSLLVAALIGLARVMAGIHWPGDVLAGALLGMAFSIIANRLITYYTARRW
jgi:undecaprenyl-diphosphatase